MGKSKLQRMLVGAALVLSMGAGALSVSASSEEQPEKTIRIYSNRTESHVAYQILQDIIGQYQEEVNPNFKAEFECEPNLDQYKNKLK